MPRLEPVHPKNRTAAPSPCHQSSHRCSAQPAFGNCVSCGTDASPSCLPVPSKSAARKDSVPTSTATTTRLGALAQHSGWRPSSSSSGSERIRGRELDGEPARSARGRKQPGRILPFAAVGAVSFDFCPAAHPTSELGPVFFCGLCGMHMMHTHTFRKIFFFLQK